MEITSIVGAGRQLINAYGNGGFRIAGKLHTGSVLVFPERTLPWAPTGMADLNETILLELLGGPDNAELLLLGCGSRVAALPEALRDGLREAGIVTECMDTGAACRTFNVLLAEDRRVAAALIAVE